MLTVKDDAGQPVYPVGGARVFAVKADHFAVADSLPPPSKEYGFVYLNLRMAKGRTASVHQRAGEIVSVVVKEHFAPLIAAHLVGITFQIDEGHEVFDLKYSSLHPHFSSRQ